jgi:hypothetical protein
MENHPGVDPWRSKVGHQEQLFGSRLLRLADGNGEGSRLIQVWTAAGLAFDIAVDRGFDLYRVFFRGRGFDWLGPSGFRSRFEYEPQGWGWLRNFHGGLLVTCGLDHVLFPITRKVPEFGFPADRDVEFGLHGRVSNQGAELLAREIMTGDDGPIIRIRGLVNQSALYNETLLLDRVITVPALGSQIEVVDTVSNCGYRPTHHEMLYHINFGFPLIDAGTSLSLQCQHGREEMTVGDPHSDFPEQVTSHDMAGDKTGHGSAHIANPRTGQQVELRYGVGALPRFNVWYMMQAGVYAVGLEPMSLRPGDRRLEDLDFLQPQESRTYELMLRFDEASASAEKIV